MDCDIRDIRDCYVSALCDFYIVDEMEYFAMMNRWY